MSLIKKVICSILLGTSASWAMIQEENMPQTQQYEVRPGRWKFFIATRSAAVEKEAILNQSLWSSESEFFTQLKNDVETVAILDPTVYARLLTMPPFKKSKLEEGLQKFSANVVKQSTNNEGWEEAGDQFGVGLEENNMLEATPVNWSILNLGVDTPDRIYLFIYQNGQDDNEDQKFFELRITYNPQED